ncbi:MAG: hypothetical protein IJ766_02255 [Clostridia bacterium]|nr:hypothetical protein [Clostridia bacterium]
MAFVKHPHLPAGKCQYAAAGGLGREAAAELRRLGVVVLPVAADTRLPIPLQTHADMLIHYLGGGQAAVADSQCDFCAQFSKLGGKIMHTVSVGEKYPSDVPLNAAVLKNIIICNSQCFDGKLLENYRLTAHSIIHVKQGYTKCAIAVVAERAIVTEDVGIYHAVKSTDIDVLLVRQGYVALPPYDCGFIGGCCGKLDRHVLAFNGRIEQHPDYRNLRDFAANYGVSLYCLTNQPLYDNGGIIPITEGKCET